MEDREMRIIRIRNLFDDRIDEELLYELFLQAGPINSIHMPLGPNGRKTIAILEYTHEQAVPFAMFIFKGTELYGVRLSLQTNNPNEPLFYNQNSREKMPHDHMETIPPNMMMNISNDIRPEGPKFSSPSGEPNFEVLLQMGQNLLIPPPLGFGAPLSLPPYLGGYNQGRDLMGSDLRHNRNNDRDQHGRDKYRERDRYEDRGRQGRDDGYRRKDSREGRNIYRR